MAQIESMFSTQKIHNGWQIVHTGARTAQARIHAEYDIVLIKSEKNVVH